MATARRKAASASNDADLRLFSPPANVDDMDECVRAIWHSTMSNLFTVAVANVEKTVGAGRSQFYLPTRTPHGATETTIPVVWPGFPRSLRILHPRDQALEAAEKLAYFGSENAMTPRGTALNATPPFMVPRTKKTLRVPYRLQDEYLEWRCERDRRGRIIRVTFTCEGFEYWKALAAHDPSIVVKLYRQYVHPSVRWEDLCWTTDAEFDKLERYKKGEYNPRNKWNTTHGIMHLTHWANTLSAEVSLASAASILRKGAGTKYLTESARLMCSAIIGDPGRSSDLQILGNMNNLAQTGAGVSLAIPVGLYIDQVDANCVTDEDGRPVPNYWRVLRGEPGVPGDLHRPSRILRLEYAVPPGTPYSVGDLYVDGERIAYGGQLAMHVHMKVLALLRNDGKAPNRPHPHEALPYRLQANHDCLFGFSDPTEAAAFEPAFPSDAQFRNRRAKR